MSEFHGRDAEREGRRGSTIDSEKGGCYLGIPQNPGHPTEHPSVTINPVSTKSRAVQAASPTAPKPGTYPSPGFRPGTVSGVCSTTPC